MSVLPPGRATAPGADRWKIIPGCRQSAKRNLVE
jgi:hypothetical protein